MERGEERKKRRERSVVWRGIEGKDQEERRRLVEGMIERELGRIVRVRDWKERRGEMGLWVVIAEMEERKDKGRHIGEGEG